MNFFNAVKDRIQGKAPKGTKRSSKWSEVRKAFLQKNNKCAICGSTTKLEVHHLVPFHFAPDLELDEKNLIILCESKKFGINCHLLVGHLGDYKLVNNECELDAMIWNKKLQRT